MLKKYLDYLNDNPQGYWFKSSPFGWGWVPVRWQGWFVVVVSMAIISLGYYIGEVDDAPGMILLGFLLGIAFIIAIGSWKGEKSCWQWGLPKKKAKR